MATPKSAAKLRTAGRVCNVGAWVIAALGIGTVGIYISTLIPLVPLFRQYQGLSPYTYSTYINVIATLFFMAISTIFFAILLYALGKIMEHMSGAEIKTVKTRSLIEEENYDDNEDREDERIRIVPLPEMR